MNVCGARAQQDSNCDLVEDMRLHRIALPAGGMPFGNGGSALDCASRVIDSKSVEIVGRGIEYMHKIAASRMLARRK